MKGTSIGEFEELVLLSIAINHGNAYSLSVLEDLKQRTGRKILISSVHKVLTRLEKKNLITSRMGEPTADRGGRAKKLYCLTASGKEVVQAVYELRSSMFHAIPDIVWNR